MVILSVVNAIVEVDGKHDDHLTKSTTTLN